VQIQLWSLHKLMKQNCNPVPPAYITRGNVDIWHIPFGMLGHIFILHPRMPTLVTTDFLTLNFKDTSKDNKTTFCLSIQTNGDKQSLSLKNIRCELYNLNNKRITLAVRECFSNFRWQLILFLDSHEGALHVKLE
jgi:hypothetical protein